MVYNPNYLAIRDYCSVSANRSVAVSANSEISEIPDKTLNIGIKSSFFNFKNHEKSFQNDINPTQLLFGNFNTSKGAFMRDYFSAKRNAPQCRYYSDV